MGKLTKKYKNIKYKVEHIYDAMVECNGKKLYKITIEDFGDFNDRAYSLNEAIEIAKETIDDEFIIF